MKCKPVFSITLAVVMFGFLAVNSVGAEVYTQADYWPFHAGLSWTFNTSGEEWYQEVGSVREESSFTDVTEMIRLVVADMAFDGHTATLNILFGDDVSGPPDYNGSYYGIETEGIIAYGNHSLKTNNEIWDNGKIWLPAQMEIGQTYVDNRCTSWYGAWEDGTEWSGSYAGSMEVIGFEEVSVPAGTFLALKVEAVDSRGKIATSDPGHTASEENTDTFWFAEGIGPVKMEWTQTREYYRDYELVASDGQHVVMELAHEPLAGDFDNDGDVDGSDFGLWQSGYPTASGATLGDGDADGDEDVDGTDFGIWQANYPTNVGGAATIPEPATLGLLIMGSLALMNPRRVLLPRKARR